MSKNEAYEITFKGLISKYASHGTVTFIVDAIELYMRRFDFNAIVFDGKNLIFTKAVKKK